MIRDLSPLAYAMTRIGAKITGLFSPGQAIQPISGFDQVAGPRQYQYPVAVNLNRLPRRDYPGLTPFEMLRWLVAQHPVAGLCVRARAEQVSMLPLRIVAKDTREQAALNRDCDDLAAWLATPDRETPLSSWLHMLIRELLELDAPTVYKRPAAGGGIAGLEVIDGATIKPIIDVSGRSAGYQQILYGLALSQYRERAALGEEVMVGEYAPGEIWYQPYWPTTTTPYGRPPMEDLLRVANIDIQKLTYDLAHFTDGNIPAALGVLDKDSMLTPDQVFAFEEIFNADLQSNPARAGYLKLVPFPLRVERLKELTEGGRYESAQEEAHLKLVCAYYGVTPTEIGFTADVNKATSEGQEGVTYRRGIRPLTSWLCQTLFTPFVQRDLGYTALEARFDFGESEDRLINAQEHQIYVSIGALTPQEVRAIAYPNLPGQTQPLGKAALEPPDTPAWQSAERQMRDLLTDLFAGQLDRLAAWLDIEEQRTLPAVEAFFTDELAPTIRLLLPFVDRTLAGVVETIDLIVSASWDLVNAAALDVAKQEATALATQITQTTKAQAAKIIADWIETGGTLDDLTQRLSLLYPASRAEMIAATEVTRIYAEGNTAAWKASGIVTGYRWQTTRDERVCPVCGPRHNERYAFDEGPMPPAHPRCRCWITPEVDG